MPLKRRNGKKTKKNGSAGSSTTGPRVTASNAIERPTRLPLHKFRESTYKNFTTTAGTDYFSAYAFSLDQLGNADALAKLFDEYRIVEIDFGFMPETTMSYPSLQLPTSACIVDWDDSNPPSSWATLLQYQNFKEYPAGRSWTRRFQPAAARSFYQSATSSGYGRAMSPWLDMNYMSVPHYGVKLGIHAGTAAMTVSIPITFFVECRASR